MIRKNENRFFERIMLKKRNPSMIRKVGTGFPKGSCSKKGAEHDPEKWNRFSEKIMLRRRIRA
jgi:hypothetical protein